MAFLAQIGVILLLAFLAESLVEYLVGTPVDHIAALSKFKWLLIYISAVVGVGMALIYKLDMIALLAGALQAPIPQSVMGNVLTGLAIGRGANYIHQIVGEYFPKPKPA